MGRRLVALGSFTINGFRSHNALLSSRSFLLVPYPAGLAALSCSIVTFKFHLSSLGWSGGIYNLILILSLVQAEELGLDI